MVRLPDGHAEARLSSRRRALAPSRKSPRDAPASRGGSAAMFDFTATLAQFPLFLHGAAVTLTVSLFGAVLGIVFGGVLFFARRSAFAPLRYLAEIYVSIVRGTPLLVQIFLVYYALPSLTGINLPAFPAGVLALSLNSG